MSRRLRRVRWSEAAARDLEAIGAFIARDSKLAAERIQQALCRRARTLDRHPERGRIVPEIVGHGVPDVRELAVRPYRIVYRIRDDIVLVVGVFDGRRDLRSSMIARLLLP